jgi:hypothetical protein
MWNYKTPMAAGIQAAFNWLLPYATEQKSWPYQQIRKYNNMTELLYSND